MRLRLLNSVNKPGLNWIESGISTAYHHIFWLRAPQNVSSIFSVRSVLSGRCCSGTDVEQQMNPSRANDIRCLHQSVTHWTRVYTTRHVCCENAVASWHFPSFTVPYLCMFCRGIRSSQAPRGTKKTEDLLCCPCAAQLSWETGICHWHSV